MTSTSDTAKAAPFEAPGSFDQAAFDALETAFGDTLQQALSTYTASSDKLCERLQTATECAFWQEAVRLAIELGDEARGMGFAWITAAVRKFADATYHSGSPHVLRNHAQMVVFEYERLRLALESRFPGLVARGPCSVA